MIAGVRENLSKASQASDKLSLFLLEASTIEPAAELSMRLVKMSDDARCLSFALEKLVSKDADAKERVKAERERERYHQKKAEREAEVKAAEIQAAMNVASEAASSAAEQAMPTGEWFVNWAATVPPEDVNEAEVEEGQSV